MWTMTVVVLGVRAESCLEMLAGDRQHPVQALATDGPAPPLSDRVRLRRTTRREDHVHAFGFEDHVERDCELPITVADQEPERVAAIVHCHREVARLLNGPSARRVRAHASDMHTPRGVLDKEQYVQPPQHRGFGREEIARQNALRLSAQKLSPASGPRAGALDPRQRPSASPKRSREATSTPSR